MKRSALVLGLVVALLVPASLAVAQSDDAPVAEQARLGDGHPEDCPYYQANGEPRLLRLQEGEGRQNGPGWGQGSEGTPHRAGYGPGECDGDCEGEGPFGPRADDAPYGPFGEQDGSGPSYGPGEGGNGAGPQNGEGPIHDGPRDGSGSQFGNGQGGNGRGGNA